MRSMYFYIGRKVVPASAACLCVTGLFYCDRSAWGRSDRGAETHSSPASVRLFRLRDMERPLLPGRDIFCLVDGLRHSQTPALAADIQRVRVDLLHNTMSGPSNHFIVLHKHHNKSLLVAYHDANISIKTFSFLFLFSFSITLTLYKGS